MICKKRKSLRWMYLHICLSLCMCTRIAQAFLYYVPMPCSPVFQNWQEWNKSINFFMKKIYCIVETQNLIRIQSVGFYFLNESSKAFGTRFRTTFKTKSLHICSDILFILMLVKCDRWEMDAGYWHICFPFLGDVFPRKWNENKKEDI